MEEETLTSLNSFESETVSLFMAGAAAFSLPKSVGAIYGLLFASADALSLDDFVERLQISKGSGSQGLRFLQRIGAVKPVYSANERRTGYVAETSLRRLIIGLLNENVVPHLKSSVDQIGKLREELKDSASDLDKEKRELLGRRVKLLESWNKKGRMLLPVVEKFLAGPLG